MTTNDTQKSRLRLSSSFAAAMICTLAANAAEAASLNVGNRSFQRLCPTHIAGDREFSGNGPDVTQFVGLKKDPTGQVAILDVFVNWLETKSNFTEAEYDTEHLLGVAPGGKQFTHVWAPDANGSFAWRPWQAQYFDSYLANYRDTDHAADNFFPSVLPDTGIDRVWWIDQVSMKGDTKGNDVGNCTEDDAYVSLTLPTIWLWY